LSDAKAADGGQRARDVDRFFRRLDVNPRGAGAGADLDVLLRVLHFEKISIRL